MRTSAEWVELLAGGLRRELLGPLAGQPVLVAALDGSPADHALAGLTRNLPCVTVGIAPAGGTPATLPPARLPPATLPPAALPPAAPARTRGAAGPAAEGAGTLAPDLDVLLTGEACPPRPWVAVGAETAGAAEVISAAVMSSPQAAVSLVQLLRLGSRLVTSDALVAESLVYSMLQAGPEYQRWLATRHPRRPKPQTEPPVLLDRFGSVLQVTLNRPQARNAYNTELRDGLVAALDLVRADPDITEVHLAGAGAAFCSGGDLAEFGSTPDPATAHIIRTTRNAAMLLTDCPALTVAHVHGACVGAGAELASFANRVVARPDTYFLLPEVSMGLVPGAGGTAGLPRRVGRQRTAWLALTGTRLDVDTALAWGLVDEIDRGPGPAAT